MKELKIRKSGIFYETFDEDASILHYLFSYKMIDDRVAFPSNSLDKVLEIIKENKINYVLINKEGKQKEDFESDNNYEEILRRSLNREKIESCFLDIIPKLEALDEEVVTRFLEELESKVNSFSF